MGEEYRWSNVAGYLSSVRTVIYYFPFNSPLGEKELLERKVAIIGIDRTANTHRLARFLKRLGHRIIALPDHLRNDNTKSYFEAFETEGLAVADCPLPFTAGGMRKAMNKHGVTAACFRGDSTASLAICGLRAAGGHIYQILKTQNMAPGNAGVILWTDILLPIIGFALLYAQWKTEPLIESNVTAHRGCADTM